MDDKQLNLNISTEYSTNLINSIAEDMHEQDEYENERILRLEKDNRFNRRISLFSLIVGILALIIATLTLIATII